MDDEVRVIGGSEKKVRADGIRGYEDYEEVY